MAKFVSILTILIIVLVFWINDLDEIFSDEITTYGIKCKDFSKKLNECTKFSESSASIQSFKILIDSQVVIIKDDVYGAKQVVKQGSCAVWNKENWYCGKSKKYYSMSDGELKLHTSSKRGTHYFSKWKWLLKGGWRYYINF